MNGSNAMKRPWILGCIAVVSLFLLPASSVWEGAAVQADGGLLPEKGYFIATSSFPRNTLVDIVNLENNRTLRVVVVQELDTAGLLALVSKEAAEYLGMKPRVVTRIRMSMPADPIAFSRFNEELVAPRDPDRNPSVFVEQNRARSEDSLVESPIQEEAPVASLVENKESVPEKKQEEIPVGPSLAETTAPSVPVPEQLSTVPEAEALAEVPVPQGNEGAVDQESSLAENKKEELPPVPAFETPPDLKKAEVAHLEGVPPEEGKITEVPEPSLVSQPSQEQKAETLYPQEPPAEVTLLIAEEPPQKEEERPVLSQEEKGTLSEAPPLTQGAPTTPPVTPRPEETEMVLVPAEERPPVLDIPEDQLPESARVATLPSASPLPAPKEEKPQGEINLEIKEVPLEVVPTPTTETVAPVVKGPVKEVVPEVLPEKKASIPERILHVPVVRSLERGTYYIQLGSFRSAASLEGAIAKLHPRYPAVVQVSENKGELLYRLFVGPLNQGESTALLQQMKRLGYKDAFVKKEG